MVSYHPIQEEANLLYYRTVPPRFDPSTLDRPSSIQKPDMSCFQVNQHSAHPLSQQPSSTATSSIDIITPIPLITTTTELSNNYDKKSKLLSRLSPLSTMSVQATSSSPSKSPRSPSSITKQKKSSSSSPSVKSFLFRHHRSDSGASGSFDSAIRTVLE